MIARQYRFVYFLSLVFFIVGTVFVYYHHRTSIRRKDIQEVPALRYPRHRLQISGFKFTGHYDGKKIISIKADKFTIEKKKLGFFRLGLLNVARFKNAVIDIYGERAAPGKNATAKSPAQDTGSTTHISARPVAPDFSSLFTDGTLPSFPAKRISSLIIEPVHVNLHDEESLVARIAASSAIIRLRQRDIVFKGNVIMESGPRMLHTDRLSLLPEHALVRVERQFVLETPEGRLEGNKLATNIFLKD